MPTVKIIKNTVLSNGVKITDKEKTYILNN